MGRQGNLIALEMDLNRKEDMQEILLLFQISPYVVLKNATMVKVDWDEGIQETSNDPVRSVFFTRTSLFLFFFFFSFFLLNVSGLCQYDYQHDHQRD